MDENQQFDVKSIRQTSSTTPTAMSAANAPSSSAPGNVVWNWVSNTTASNSDDVTTQITCYAFPYGSLGFVAHLVMFYGIAVSSLNKCPWRPRRPLMHSGFDIITGIVGLVIACIFASVTIFRCSGATKYIFIASSKICMAITSSAIGVHIAWNIHGRKGESDKNAGIKLTHHKTLRWFMLEFLGSIVELAGVVMVIKEEDRDAVDKKKQTVMIISLIFAGFMGFLLSGGIIWLELQQRAQRRVEWEVRKVQAKCTTLEERLVAQQPRGRGQNRRHGIPDEDEGARVSLRPDAPRRSGQQEPAQAARRDQASPLDQERDVEAQGLADEGEVAKEPVLYNYEDVLKSVKQLFMVAGAAFSISVTLYTDWILAAVSGSYLGFPTTGNVPLTVVYVFFYFVVRLIPFIPF